MKRKICLFLAAAMMIFSMSSAAYATELDKEKFEQDVDFMEKVIYFVLDNYQYEVSQEDVMNGLYDGFFGILDDYSVYYTPKEYQAMLEDTAGEFSGIGVQIIDVDGQVVVLTPLADSPALEAGIKAGDIIKYVDGKDITGLTVNEASMLIRGVEGTKVKIGVVREGKDITFELTRRTIVTSSVEGNIMENNIGYLKVTEFSDNTVKYVKEELAEFDKNNVEKIVIDMRNNGGGTLDAAVDMLNLFVTEGDVVYVDYATGNEDVYTSYLEEQKYEIAVLINEGSASATEIFAGAVKYKKEGTIIGTQSFGKGIVQTLYPLVDGSGVKFTTAEYFSVDRTPVHKIGITPDIIVENETMDLSRFPAFSNTNKPVLGSVSLDVLAAEMILDSLGYEVSTPDGVYDQSSFNQMIKYQEEHSLYPYGTIDYATQKSLYSSLLDHSKNSIVDKQLQTAVDVLTKQSGIIE